MTGAQIPAVQILFFLKVVIDLIISLSNPSTSVAY